MDRLSKYRNRSRSWGVVLLNVVMLEERATGYFIGRARRDKKEGRLLLV